MARTSKGQTNAKWTSSEEFRNNYDQIFGKKKSPAEVVAEELKPQTELGDRMAEIREELKDKGVVPDSSVLFCRNGKLVDHNGREHGACLNCEGTACD